MSGLDSGTLGTTLRRPPRLLFQFALFTGLGLALAGATILLFVRHFEHERAREAAVHEAQVAADFVAGDLGSRDLGPGAAGLTRAELERLLGRVLAAGDVAGAAFVSTSGEVAHAVGARAIPDQEALRTALTGTAATELTAVTAPSGGTTDVLSAAVPIRRGSRTLGVLVVTREYGPIAEAARSALLPVAGVLELVLLVLWAALFPVLTRATRRLRRQVELIRHLAFHDSLTGLPNRTVFRDDVTRALGDDGSTQVAVMLVDLDRFKEVNDTLGHRTGDLLLAELGPRLSSALGAEVTVARLGGDEFGIVSTIATDADTATALAERVLAVVETPIELAGLSLEMRSSVGIALGPAHGTDVDTLLRHADVALYVSKEAQRPIVYDAGLDRNSTGRLALGAELRRAVEADDQLVAYFQPQVDPATGTVLGVEALVRWQHPTRGLVAPDEFLPLAERTGLSRAITRMVLEQTLTECAGLEHEGRPLDLYVNLSGADLVDAGLPEEVTKALAAHGVPPRRLHLEITESALASDRARAAGVLDRLQASGIRIALDDFGTGWSSLGDLRRLPVDLIKIDRSFVMSMADEAGDAVIVRATIALTHGLGLQVVAEGVSDEETLQELARLGCDGIQGFHISPALPVADLVTWLRGWHASAPSCRAGAVPVPVLAAPA